MGLFDGIKEWFLRVALQKAASKGAKAGIAVVFAPAVIAFLAQHGVNVQVDNNVVEASVIGGIIFGYEFVRNFLKGKGLSFLP